MEFFSFRSSSSPSLNNLGNESIPTDSKVCRDKPWQSEGDDAIAYSLCRGGTQKNPLHKSSTKSSGKKRTSASHTRRALSFSSLSTSDVGNGGEGQFSSFVDGCGAQAGCNNASHRIPDSPVRSQFGIPIGRSAKSERCYVSSVRRLHPFEDSNSPSYYNKPNEASSENLRSSDQNKILQPCVNGDEQRPETDQRLPLEASNGGCLVGNSVPVNFGQPLQAAQSTPPSSPTYFKEDLRVRSFTGDKHCNHLIISGEDWAEEGGIRRAFSQKPRKRFVRKFSRALSGRSKIMAGEYDSDATTTNDDIYENASELYQDQSSDGDIYSCNHSDFPDVCRNEEDIAEQELSLKLEEAEERFNLMSEFDVELEKLQNGGSVITRSRLLQVIKDINGDRMKMAVEALTQVKDRISERSCAREVLKKVKIDFATRLKRQVNEKNRLESSLKHELDRSSGEQSSKLVKLQAEELRLRERVRKFAEHNVSLQREVSSITGREEETHIRITNLEVRLNELMTRLEEMKAENQNLQKALSEVQARSDSVEADRDCMARSCREKEKEKKEFHAIVVKFQRMCGEHEKTIAGLRQACRDADDVAKKIPERDDLLSRLRVEHIRLSGIEQTLRKEVESYRNEAETLRQENISLLHRLQQQHDGSHGGGRSWFKLEHELRARLELLQSRGLEMLFAHNDLCGRFLDILKAQQENNHHGIDVEFDGYYVVEYSAKFQGLRRGIENLKRSLQTVSAVLKEKSHIEEEGSERPQATKNNIGLQSNVELELKAESLLTKVLREKLCSKELEFEQLREDFASSLTSHEKVKVEIQRLQNKVSSLQHESKDMEVQILRKDENLNETKHNLEKREKELVGYQDSLVKVWKDRDFLRVEVSKLKETNMVLNCEVNSLKKKIENLEEEVFTKEGQINILKDHFKHKH